VTPLEQEAKRLLSEKTTLGSRSIRTGLCIVAKRADTFSTWPYVNHPRGKFYAENAEIPLWKLVRATSAAPTYFRPIRLDVGRPGAPDYGVFIDGGVSMANNPALQLFFVATLKGFPFHWKTGEHDLLIVSVGTGRWKQTLSDHEILKSENVYWAKNVPDLLMHDASKQNELMLQYLSKSPTARQIDWEVGSLDQDLLGGTPHFSYLRYNAVLERSALADIGETVTERDLSSLRDMSVGKNAKHLYAIGAAFAQRQVDSRHFPAAFDPAPISAGV
jgi:predicted acylesterase/phospholipase RssA